MKTNRPLLIAILSIGVIVTGIVSYKLFANGTPADKERSKTKLTYTIQITKSEFLQKVVDFETDPNGWKYLGDKPAMVDFYADWCGPCKAIAPVLEELAEQYKDQIYIYKVNTDQEQELSQAFGIRSIPSMLFIPMEGEPQMSMGALPKSELKKIIEQTLLKNK